MKVKIGIAAAGIFLMSGLFFTAHATLFGDFYNFFMDVVNVTPLVLFLSEIAQRDDHA